MTSVDRMDDGFMGGGGCNGDGSAIGKAVSGITEASQLGELGGVPDDHQFCRCMNA